MARKIVIIGGGIAGLSAGCYGRMNGYETEIFEMHTAPGGVCTGWTRKGFTFDGCLHFLVGTGSAGPIRRMWDELGALDGRRIYNHEVFCDMVLPSGKRLTQYSDVNRLVAHLKEAVAPSARDARRLDVLASDVRLWTGFGSRMGSAKAPAQEPGIRGFLARMRGMWKIRRYLPMFRRYGVTIEQYAAGYRHPDLRAFFELALPIEGMPAMNLLMIASIQNEKAGGWPEGGSLGLARAIWRRYTDLGGVIHFGAKVEEIVVRDGRAVGIRLADGAVHEADEVISAADGRTTLFGMLKGRYMTAGLREAYSTLPLYLPFVQVSYGLRRLIPLTELPRLRTIRPSAPVEIGGERPPFLMLNNYSFDPTMAPAGKTALTVLYQSPWEGWEKLQADKTAYAARKARVLSDTTAWLETMFPGIAADIEATDVATPLTTVHFTGNHKGSYEGWRPTVATMRREIERRIPSLAHFAMIGQWTRPAAGLPTAAQDGRRIIQELCEQEGKPFVAGTPAARKDQGAA